MEEEWRWVPGREGRYQVSSQGRVKSFLFSQSGKLMKLDIVAVGYARVHFQFKQTWLVHRLVAKTFIPNPLELPVVNHRDGNKLNNCVSNLEWATHSDNMRHSWRNLEVYKNRVAVSPRGERSPNHKLVTAQVLEIGAKYATGSTSQRKLAEEYGVSKPLIRHIVKRKAWAHI